MSATRRGVIGLGLGAAALVAAPLRTAAAQAVRRIRLNLNENAFGPSPRVAPALARAATGIERYVEQGEVDTLAGQIAALEGVSPEQVVVGEVLEPLGLFLARRQRGGEVVYAAPGYTALIDAAEALGGRGVPVPLDARLENDLPALARAIGSRTSAVSLVNPHNPSGTVSDAAALDAFIRDAARRTLVVIDEAYLEYDDLAARSAIRHVREGANVLVFRTLAKAYGLAGLSIGYAVAPPGLARDLRAAGIGAPHSLGRPALAAAAAALADQRHIATVREANRRERERYHALLDARRWRRTDSRGNFVFFQAPDAPGLRQRLAERGVAIGRVFAPYDDWLRITVGRPAENAVVLAILRDWAGAS